MTKKEIYCKVLRALDRLTEKRLAGGGYLQHAPDGTRHPCAWGALRAAEATKGRIKPSDWGSYVATPTNWEFSPEGAAARAAVIKANDDVDRYVNVKVNVNVNSVAAMESRFRRVRAFVARQAK